MVKTAVSAAGQRAKQRVAVTAARSQKGGEEAEAFRSWIAGLHNPTRAPRRPRNDDRNREIGERVRFLRVHVLKLELQKDLAEKLRVSRAAVTNWEIGKGISRESLQLLCDLCGARIEWLTTGIGEPLRSKTLEDRMQLLPPEDREDFEQEVLAMLEYRLGKLGRTDDG